MPLNRYVIMRAVDGSLETVRQADPENIPALHIEETDLTEEEVRSLKTDPFTLAVPPVVPTKLIEPTSQSPSKQTDGGWNIDAVLAHQSPYSGRGIRIAVLDTGIDPAHAAFSDPNLMIEEQDFSGDGNGDQRGHGTHAAGIIFGRDVQHQRIGVARGVTTVYAGKVLNDVGQGSARAAYNGILWALQNRVHIISLSLGFDYQAYRESLLKNGVPGTTAASMILAAQEENQRALNGLLALSRSGAVEGALIVAASGNTSHRQPPSLITKTELPAAADHVIAVGAVEPRDELFGIASFSNRPVQLVAPGVDILSARANHGSDLIAMTGTSMACPHITGLAALWWEKALRDGIPKDRYLLDYVRAQLIASCRRGAGIFSPDTQAEDIGSGLATAP